MSGNGEAPSESTWPFDEAGLRESCGRAADRLWWAEQERRGLAPDLPYEWKGAVTLALLQDPAGRLVLGFGYDYPDGLDPFPMLVTLAEGFRQKLMIEQVKRTAPAPPSEAA